MDERLNEGIELFNRGEYFEAHETIERLWLATSSEEKDFLKGLIQCAVSLHHLTHDNLGGAKKVYATARAYLEAHPSGTLQVDSTRLIREMDAVFKAPAPETLPKINKRL